MKKVKVFLLITFMLVGIQGFGQNLTDKFMLGTSSNLSFSSTKSAWQGSGFDTDEISNTYFNISFEGGMFIKSWRFIGVKLPISFYSIIDENGEDYSETEFSLNPFVHFYFTENYYRPFINISVGLGKLYDKINSNEKYSYLSFNYQIGGGVAFILHERIIAEFCVNYGAFSYLPESSDIAYVTKGFESEIGIKFIIF